MKTHDEKIERLALTLLRGLMLRYKEDGYTDRSAIGEAFRLAKEYYKSMPSCPNCGKVDPTYSLGEVCSACHCEM